MGVFDSKSFLAFNLVIFWCIFWKFWKQLVSKIRRGGGGVVNPCLEKVNKFMVLNWWVEASLSIRSNTVSDTLVSMDFRNLL